MQKGSKISQYNGVHWHKNNKKWYAQIVLPGAKKKYGGGFKDELDAAKRVNQLCEEMGTTLKNSGIGSKPNQEYQYQVTLKNV